KKAALPAKNLPNQALITARKTVPMGSIKRTFWLFFIFLFPLTISFAESVATPLAAEISRLEKLSFGSGNAGDALERYSAYIHLARLLQLSGDSGGAIKAYNGALALFPGDGRSLFELGRLLISTGEYETAVPLVNALLANNQYREIYIEGRFLAALLEAFRSGNTQNLALLADDPEFLAFRSFIFYALWKVSGLPAWKNRLIAEFPQSPEGRIAGGSMDSAATPLWLLFPGRDGLVISSAVSPVITAAPAAPPAGPSPGPITGLLQAGLFGSEENARAFAGRLGAAGFQAQISPRTVNNNNYWAVCVPYGNDMNAEILKLKNAGFESFPVAN
ncbi:MAG: SPOR domain-containing protein, partial [Treponema sp.]|nr:SPOR domain-containing protein [Treponema sp.]